ncbi:FtsK/SpoIIIE domain-containing protein [Acrocarpospora catenulata]|uniref:FtsK/SpoIIIE domain-containing protein n=1 Tax=Acrocarpospora catenulata TaxID=2836182 RepID=UPI002023B52B|nr:FtsK/SpoIIIE domain-containing protein [Acrocarpospora catenulata]
MILLDDLDRDLVSLVVEFLARAGWRYRSELAPITTTALVVVADWVLHRHDPRWWPHVLVVTTAATVAVLLLGSRAGLASMPERVYAAVMLLLTGLWLAVATVRGPLAEPLPVLLAVCGLLGAVPWWAHRRRRARVRVERTLAAWPEISRAVGLTGSRVQSAVVDAWGWRARLALARGQTPEDVIAKLPALESALGTRRGAVRILPIAAKANRAELRVIATDPHADAIPWRGPSIASMTEPLELGVFEDGTPVRVSFLRRHALLAGIAGSGKSGGVNVIMGNLAACPDTVVWGVDLKRGMELGPWASCLDRLATTPGEADALLADAAAILEARADWLASRGKRVWEPSPEFPALVIVIDEYAELAEESPEALGQADSLARRGRAVAVTLIAATQRPSQRAMGHGAVRSQMDIRVSFRVRERRDVDLILGQGMLAAGWHAHTLDQPGKFLVSAPGHDIPRRARGALLTDATVQRTATHYGPYRPRLDEISRTALGTARTPDPHPEDEPDGPDDSDGPDASGDKTGDADTALWDALCQAPPDGASVAELITVTGMGRRWIYYRLGELTRDGRAVQMSRGRWRAHHIT